MRIAVQVTDEAAGFWHSPMWCVLCAACVCVVCDVTFNHPYDTAARNLTI